MSTQDDQWLASLREVSFADALSQAIAHRQVTLDELRSQLADRGCRVSKATLSYWRSGQSVPARPSSLAVIEDLERVLRLSPGALRSTLPTDAFSAWDLVVEFGLDDQVRAAMGVLGLPENPFATYDDILLQDSVLVPPGRLQSVETSRQLIQSKVDGLGHVVVVFRLMPEAPMPFVEAGRGCELARVVQLDDAGLVVLDFELPHALALGELHMFDYTFTWELGERLASDLFVRGHVAPIEVHTIDVTFTDELPERIAYRTSPAVLSDPIDPGDLVQELEVGPYVQLCLVDACAGKHVVAWDYANRAGGRATDGPSARAEEGLDDRCGGL